MEEELSPEQAERVRRMLAEARHDEPMPGDVVARLDRVLADLGADREGGGTVVALGSRRRRAGGLLLAAAAVVVGGVAVGSFVTGGLQAGQDESSAGEAEVAVREAPERGPEAADEEAPAQDAVPGAVSDSRQLFSLLEPRRVSSAEFTRDAAEVRDAATGVATQANRRDAQQELDATYASCPPGTWGGGRYVVVRYDRSPAWLVLRPPRGDTQVADLFLCGGEDPERSATLSFP